MATIKIYSTQATAPFTMENTGSVTLADVKSHLTSNNVNVADSKFVVRQDKLELSYADSVVPAGDQIIMVSPAKTKAGGFKSDVIETLDSIQEQLEELKAEFTQKLEEMKNYSNLSQEDKDIFNELNNGQW